MKNLILDFDFENYKVNFCKNPVCKFSSDALHFPVMLSVLIITILRIEEEKFSFLKILLIIPLNICVFSGNE